MTDEIYMNMYGSLDGKEIASKEEVMRRTIQVLAVSLDGISRKLNER